MNPNKSEKAGKAALVAALAALGAAARKYGPVVAKKAKEVIPVIMKIVFRRG